MPFSMSRIVFGGVLSMMVDRPAQTAPLLPVPRASGMGVSPTRHDHKYLFPSGASPLKRNSGPGSRASSNVTSVTPGTSIRMICPPSIGTEQILVLAIHDFGKIDQFAICPQSAVLLISVFSNRTWRHDRRGQLRNRGRQGKNGCQP